MLWHAVRFDCTGLAPDLRDEVEAALAALVDLDVVRGLRIGRDVVDPEVTGLLVALDDADALAVYRDHPQHQPVVARIRELGIGVSRFDITSPDAPTVLT